MKITRRKLAASLAAAATARAARAQISQQPMGVSDELRTARERQRSNADALTKVEIPMTVEPAFQFKA